MNEASQFYHDHKDKFFFNRLVTFMSSGPCYIHILARENAIEFWRTMMGPTKVFKTIFTHPESIRGVHGLTDTRNATHGSGTHFTNLILSQDFRNNYLNLFYRFTAVI